MKKRPPMPPWTRDPRPDLWVPVMIAARFYFRKSRATVKRYIKDGTLDEIGILSYWDGTRWYIRLPNGVQTAHIPRKVA